MGLLIHVTRRPPRAMLLRRLALGTVAAQLKSRPPTQPSRSR